MVKTSAHEAKGTFITSEIPPWSPPWSPLWSCRHTLYSPFKTVQATIKNGLSAPDASETWTLCRALLRHAFRAHA